MEKSVSVVIPSYNSDKTITRTIDSLLNQKGGHLKEVIVVDSSDNGEMDKIIREYESPTVQFINAGIKVIPALGRNIGASHARGKIIAFIDSDAYADDDWLENIVGSYRKGRLAGGGSVELPDFQKSTPVAAAQFYLQFNEYLAVGEDRVMQFIPSVNLYCDREIFRKTGGFPDIRATEDTLFGFRVSSLTCLWFVPSAKVYHIFRVDKKSFANNQKLLGRYIIIYRRQQYRNVMYRGIIPALLLPGFLLVKFARIVFRIFSAGPGHAIGFIKVIHWFLYGLAYWSNGFLRGCLADEE